MNDQLKKYVEDNREEFDHLTPSADVLFRIKNELKVNTEEKKTGMRLMVNFKWLVAASILITISISYLVTTQDESKPITEQLAKKTLIPEKVHQFAQVPVKKTAKKQKKSHSTPTNMLKVYAGLGDSSSASARMAAILDIQKSNMMSYDLIDKLAKTLNHDPNPNVRLAALHLMSKYAQDRYVTNAFVQALTNQKDPLIQLGLIELLSKTDSPKLDDNLYALANDPNTATEVKEGAYLVLLNQNKL